MFEQDEECAARRTISNSDSSSPAYAESQPPAFVPPELWPDARLSDALTWHYQRLRGGTRWRKKRFYAFWELVKFLQGDFPLREVRFDPNRFLCWLDATPIAPRLSRSLPPDFSHESLVRFLRQPPPTAAGRGQRSEQRLGGLWRAVRPLAAWLHWPTQLDERIRPSTALPEPWVPLLAEIGAWWREILARPAYLPGRRGRAVPWTLRRRIVLTLALALLTGMRRGELLTVSAENVEGPWLLVPKIKTRPRIIYLSPAAVAIVAALRQPPPGQQLPLFDAGPLVGWRHSASYWSHIIAGFRLEVEKIHQSLRRACSSFMHARDAVAEAQQLGHGGKQAGGAVIYEHYLGRLERIPAVLDGFELPAVPGWTWPPPVRLPADRPKGLYERCRRLIEGSDRRAARREFLAKAEGCRVNAMKRRASATRTKKASGRTGKATSGRAKTALAVLVAVIVLIMIWKRLIY